MLTKFAFEDTTIKGLTVVTPFCAEDERGCFIKDYSQETFSQNGITHDLKEIFYTVSHTGVIRAIHFQREREQPKLVRCIAGGVYDVVVDLRAESDTFGEWQGFYLTGDNRTELLIPGGCGHGYLVLEPSVVSYKCAEKFYGEYDDGIIWNDKDLDVKWPLNRINVPIILAEKDKKLQSFAEFKAKYGGLK